MVSHIANWVQIDDVKHHIFTIIYGNVGSGKTAFAKSIAKEARVLLITDKASFVYENLTDLFELVDERCDAFATAIKNSEHDISTFWNNYYELVTKAGLDSETYKPDAWNACLTYDELTNFMESMSTTFKTLAEMKSAYRRMFSIFDYLIIEEFNTISIKSLSKSNKDRQKDLRTMTNLNSFMEYFLEDPPLDSGLILMASKIGVAKHVIEEGFLPKLSKKPRILDCTDKCAETYPMEVYGCSKFDAIGLAMEYSAKGEKVIYFYKGEPSSELQICGTELVAAILINPKFVVSIDPQENRATDYYSKLDEVIERREEAEAEVFSGRFPSMARLVFMHDGLMNGISINEEIDHMFIEYSSYAEELEIKQKFGRIRIGGFKLHLVEV